MRQYLIGSWNNADEYSYSGEQLMGNRLGASREAQHFNKDGSANVAKYGDNTEKKPTRKQRSIAEKILPQQTRYENLCSLMDELNSKRHTFTDDDYYQYRAILKAKIDRQWTLLCKAAGWTESLTDDVEEIYANSFAKAEDVSYNASTQDHSKQQEKSPVKSNNDLIWFSVGCIILAGLFKYIIS